MGENVIADIRANRRAKTVLNKLLQSRQISESGLKWLDIATDPFHDSEIVSDGYPDMVTTRSIVQVVTKTFSIGSPSAETTTPWDFHCFFNPVSPSYRQGTTLTTTTQTTTTIKSTEGTQKTSQPLQREKAREEVATLMKDEGFRQKFPNLYKRALEDEYSYSDEEEPVKATSVFYDGLYRSTVTSGGTIGQIGSGNPLYSGWNCIGILGGQDWQTTAGDVSIGGTFPRNYGAGTYRLIGTGLEVVNTTAALYKGGAVTVYRSPCPKSTLTGRTINLSADQQVQSLGTFPVGVLPPSTQADASLFPNSKTWGAEDGVYLIGCLNNAENPFYTPSPGIAGLVSPTSATSMENGSGWISYLPKILHPNATSANNDLSACNTLWPWDISGAVFSGLNPNTTLQVTVRYYIERHPSIAEPDLLVLARTPCPYDPVVQEIYARAMHTLPVGVPVGENPLGEWFNEVLDAVATWAPQVGSALGNIIPGANLVGNAIGKGAQGWLGTRKNTKGGGPPAPKPPKGGKMIQKVKKDKKGRVREVDTIVTSKKKKYTKAEKRAYQMRMKAKTLARPKGPARRRPTKRI